MFGVTSGAKHSIHEHMSKAELQQLVIDYAYGYGIDPAIALAQIRRESNFNPNAVGADGERGLAQILPSTWPEASMGLPWANAFDPETNLTAWGNYMQSLLNRYGWDYNRALMAYNGGPGNVDRNTVSQRARNYAKSILANAGQVSIDNYSGNPDAENSILGLSFTTVLLIAGGIAAVIALRK